MKAQRSESSGKYSSVCVACLEVESVGGSGQEATKVG